MTAMPSLTVTVQRDCAVAFDNLPISLNCYVFDLVSTLPLNKKRQTLQSVPLIYITRVLIYQILTHELKPKLF